MKKNLILMTALFAGSMIVNDGFGCIILKSKSTLASPMIQQQNSVQVVEPSDNTQRDVEQGFTNFERFPGEYLLKIDDDDEAESKFKTDFDTFLEKSFCIDEQNLVQVIKNLNLIVYLRKKFESTNWETEKNSLLIDIISKSQVLHNYYELFISEFTNAENAMHEVKSRITSVSGESLDRFKSMSESITTKNEQIADFLSQHAYKNQEVTGLNNCDSSAEVVSESPSLDDICKLISSIENELLELQEQLSDMNRKSILADIFVQESAARIEKLEKTLENNFGIILSYRYSTEMAKLQEMNGSELRTLTSENEKLKAAVDELNKEKTWNEGVIYNQNSAISQKETLLWQKDAYIGTLQSIVVDTARNLAGIIGKDDLYNFAVFEKYFNINKAIKLEISKTYDELKSYIDSRKPDWYFKKVKSLYEKLKCAIQKFRDSGNVTFLDEFRSKIDVMIGLLNPSVDKAAFDSISKLRNAIHATISQCNNFDHMIGDSESLLRSFPQFKEEMIVR